MRDESIESHINALPMQKQNTFCIAKYLADVGLNYSPAVQLNSF